MGKESRCSILNVEMVWEALVQTELCFSNESIVRGLTGPFPKPPTPNSTRLGVPISLVSFSHFISICSLYRGIHCDNSE
jgi:hypothetical protein